MATVSDLRIEKLSGTPARLARMPRIRVAQIVMDYFAHSWSLEEVCRHYPHLIPAEVRAALTYYYDHQTEIDEEIQCELEEKRKNQSSAKPTPFEIRLPAKKIS
jgi:uncharacterized protein (DUF433 family)